MNYIQRLMASAAAALLATGGTASASLEEVTSPADLAWAGAIQKDTLEAYAEFAIAFPDSTFAGLAYGKLSGTGPEPVFTNSSPKPAAADVNEAAVEAATNPADSDAASTPGFVPGLLRLI